MKINTELHVPPVDDNCVKLGVGDRLYNGLSVIEVYGYSSNGRYKIRWVVKYGKVSCEDAGDQYTDNILNVENGNWSTTPPVAHL